ncbi:Ribonucleases G and E [Richelia intracellularis HM01]|uniref:Ycf66 family protein n=1 Tax=Richelia intracellularis TaxID=1164990 RepID=UPI0002B5BD55|nr:Ycf66 family protein [Richelia intracellularis]CCH65140.1 Ribonucleases G and E [Richelia intracellularis HM01]
MIIFGLNSTNILAQVNFGTNSASILGIFLAVAGASLYFLRSIRPELSRDQDIFFAAVGLLCGFILIFQGWRLDPILQFGQLLLVGTTVYFAFESIRLRGIATEQAKRNTKIVDDERPVSSNYRYSRKSGYRAEVEAELESLPYDEDYYHEDERPRARIPGSQDGRLSRVDKDYYDDEASVYSESIWGKRPSKSKRRNPVSSNKRYSERSDNSDWSSSAYRFDDDLNNSIKDERRGRERKKSYRRNSSNPSQHSEYYPSGEEIANKSRKRYRLPAEEHLTPTMADDYAVPVEYKSIKTSENESDNSTNIDDDL